MSPGEPSEARDRLEAWLSGVLLVPGPEPASVLPGAPDPATAELVFSMLVWEAGVPQAVSAARRLAGQFVDVNELRVALVGEVEDTIGLTDAHAPRRARMLIDTLMQVFEAEDAVTIDRVARSGADDARRFLLGIEGLSPFVVDRVTLLALGGHRVPVDDRLRGVLVERGIIAAHTDAAGAGALLAEWCPAERAKGLYLRLEGACGRRAMGSVVA